MSRIAISLLTTLAGSAAFGLAGGSPAHAATVDTWAHPGVSGDWSVASNWTAGVPVASTPVSLPSSTTRYTVTSTGRQSIASLYVGTRATLAVSGGYVEPAGSVVNHGALTVDRAFLGRRPGRPDPVLTNSGTLRLGSRAYAAVQVQNAANGKVSVTATNPAHLDSLANSGQVTVADGAVLATDRLLNLSASGALSGPGSLTIAGRLAVGNSSLPLPRVLSLGSRLTLQAGGQVTDSAGGNALALLRSVTPTGALMLDNAAHLRLLSSTLTNNGALALSKASSLQVPQVVQAGGGFWSLDSSVVLGSVNVTGGTFYPSGYVAGDLVNAGVVDLGAGGQATRVSVNGSYTQTASGTLRTIIGGTTPVDLGTGITQLGSLMWIGGQTTLDGTLHVTAQLLDGSRRPDYGSTWTALIPASGYSGRFSSVEQDGVEGYKGTPVYGTFVTLLGEAVPVA